MEGIWLVGARMLLLSCGIYVILRNLLRRIRSILHLLPKWNLIRRIVCLPVVLWIELLSIFALNIIIIIMLVLRNWFPCLLRRFSSVLMAGICVLLGMIYLKYGIWIRVGFWWKLLILLGEECRKLCGLIKVFLVLPPLIKICLFGIVILRKN